jgi:hypothetical protein
MNTNILDKERTGGKEAKVQLRFVFLKKGIQEGQE